MRATQFFIILLSLYITAGFEVKASNLIATERPNLNRDFGSSTNSFAVLDNGIILHSKFFYDGDFFQKTVLAYDPVTQNSQEIHREPKKNDLTEITTRDYFYTDGDLIYFVVAVSYTHLTLPTTPYV